ncbi:uncharacterized protein gNacalpha [Drosophila tropicalis]|uniref:uncharacterized protein gNacalpha n=1 Tax=Drosophila tropicalis TaxID=46794 RepID=UPI0035ABBE30
MDSKQSEEGGAIKKDSKPKPQALPLFSTGVTEGSSINHSSDNEDMPELDDVSEKNDDKQSIPISEQLASLVARQSRGEKKARRLLMKLDLKPIEHVQRVTMRKSKNILLSMDLPEVYKCLHTDTVICFGEIRVEDISNTAAGRATERVSSSPLLNPNLLHDAKLTDPFGNVQLVNDDEDDSDDSADATGIDENDIQLVQMQSACSRQKAIKALAKNDNDVVNAIMALTVG